ncbi:CysZ protein [Friedmanniella luteola]|uniref:CysZ protein n=1 Tax=Friedmanniella luteola TaxID=546871 RepID=A0A1H1YJ06_9ACTN|nr:EI24 domain-containing protein [Friedmanniella luteola]SDT21305.1 CysZ protein [Friedmanniella luteola]
MASPVTDGLAGVGLLGRGLALIARRPRLFLLGALPPLVTSTLFVVVLVLLATRGDAVVGAMTGFADGWSAGLAAAVRVLVSLGLLGGVVLLMVISFTTLTLTLGAPLYDLISEFVDRELPAPPTPPEDGWVSSLGRGLRQSVGLIAVSAGCAVALFAAGFVPLVGQLAVPVVSALVGGWLLGIELVGSALERRGVLTLRGRRELMRRRRFRVLGLCVPTFLLLAVPFVGVVVFPVATAAGTLLARQLVGESTTDSQPPRSAG